MKQLPEVLRNSREFPEDHVTTKVFERMTDDTSLVRFLNATMKLSDRDFDTVLHDQGYRAISILQRKWAAQGELAKVRAAEVYLQRAKGALAHTAPLAPETDTPAPYERPQRNTSGSDGEAG